MKRDRIIDAACIVVAAVVLAFAICAMVRQCQRTAHRELATTYRYVGDVIW